MMKATIVDGKSGPILRIEGKIAGPWVQELEKYWAAIPGLEKGASLRVELSDLTFIDEAGKQLLRKMAEEGANISGEGCLTAAILKSILPERAAARGSLPAHRKTRGHRLFVLLAILVFLVPSLVYGQDKPPLELNLHQAVDLALQQNPQVQIAALNLAETKEDSAVALSNLLPQADFNVSDRAIRVNLRASIGLSFPGFPDHAGPFQVFQTGSTFSSPIFDLSLLRRWQASRQDISGSDAERLSVREQIVLLVVSQYLSSLRANAEVQAARSRVQLAQALYDQSADLQRHGAATGIDTLRANVELQNEKQQLIVAQTDKKIALYGLSKLLNLNPGQKIELSDEASFFKTPGAALHEGLAQAYLARPEMTALLAQQRSLEDQKRAASESRFPSLRFDGAYEQQGLSSSTVIPTYTYQASVTMPLFTGGRIHAQIARDNLGLEKIAQRIAEERNQIALEVETAVARLDSARHQVEVADLGVELAREEVQQARDRFQAGVADNIEVISAQDALARANENQISALYQYNQSRADLAHALGSIEMLYSK